MKQTPRTRDQPSVVSAVCARAAGSDSRHCPEWGWGGAPGCPVGLVLPSPQGPGRQEATEWASTALENREAQALHVPDCQGTANLPEVLHVCF